MMSFVNLMANDVWSETDIKARLHAEIRSEVSELAETELNRALQGAALGLHTLTLQERESLAHFKAATDRVAALGLAARADAVLLHETMALEAAQRCVGDDETDAPQRAAAQALIDAASAGALALSLLRKQTEVTL
jgi:hypothetical protein